MKSVFLFFVIFSFVQCVTSDESESSERIVDDVSFQDSVEYQIIMSKPLLDSPKERKSELDSFKLLMHQLEEESNLLRERDEEMDSIINANIDVDPMTFNEHKLVNDSELSDRINDAMESLRNGENIMIHFDSLAGSLDRHSRKRDSILSLENVNNDSLYYAYQLEQLKFQILNFKFNKISK
ncbi:MAG: hypothetical protein ACI9N1_000799 [Flavobacteriales bacterium]|jgi:hypothetical protein